MFIKRGFNSIPIFVLLLLVIMPLAAAKITIVNNFQEMYNFGDTITVDGYILAEETADGTVTLELQCSGYSKVNSVHLTINKGHKVTFSQLGISTFTLPDTEGNCDVEAEFNGDSVNSNSFTLLNDLLGAFDVIEDEYYLGDTLAIEGIVFKLDGSDVDGSAIILLEKKGSYPVQLDEADVISGKMKFSKQLSALDYGTYYVNVKVNDGLNSQTFEHVDSFELETRLNVDVSTSKYNYEPGEEVVVSGEIEGLQSDDAKVVIQFNSLRYTTEPVAGSFEYRFFVPSSMKAGSYELSVTVSDTYGNEGSDEFDLTVLQIPATVLNVLDKSSYNPGDTLNLEVQLLDQTDKEMDGTVKVRITDPQGTELYGGDVSTRQEVELTFGKYAKDGTYTIISTYSEKNLDDTDRVTVNQVSGIGSNVEGGTIKLVNEGNINYDDHVDLVLVREDDGEKVYYVIAKDVSLAPGEEVFFDMSYDLPEGSYSFLVDDSGEVSALDDSSLAEYVDGKADEDVNLMVDDDKRAIGDKINQGFSSVTGATTISSYDRKLTPWFFLLMIVLFGGILGLYGYQRREVIKQKYNDYKTYRKKKLAEKESPISGIENSGDSGDVPKEEVDRLLAASVGRKEVKEQKVNIGTDENRKIAAIKVKHVKPGTTTLVPRTSTIARDVISDKKPGNKRNRFSTWNPPENLLNDNNFPAKNPVKGKEDPMDPVYSNIDEDFLKDEKFE